MKHWSYAALLTLLLSAPASAQIEWRVSIKLILDAGGNLPAMGSLNTIAAVQAEVDFCNGVLDNTGRGYRLDAQIITLAGQAAWSNVACTSTAGIEAAALANPAGFAWRTDAINVYVSHNNTCAGSCSFPGSGEAIILGQGAAPGVLLHEIGHYMDLCHTQGCTCGNSTCAGGPPVQCVNTPGDDLIADTADDLPCWTRNQIANFNFGSNYASLPPNLQELVDNSFLNLMSYHGLANAAGTGVYPGGGTRLTEDQMDRMGDTSNGRRAHVATGRTIFVDASFGFPPVSNGSSVRPYVDLDSALAVASDGDIILIRAGAYARPTGAITVEITMLRWSGGEVVIG